VKERRDSYILDNKMVPKNKKAQEEMTGFVLVVIIMAVIFLVFVGIMIRKPSSVSTQESRDIQQFLESTMEVTSSCAFGYEPAYASIGDLLRRCNEGSSICTSGKNPCEVLNESLSGILDSAYPVGSDRPEKGYDFKITYQENSSSGVGETQMLELVKGQCKGDFKSAEYLSPSGNGNLLSSFKLCL
jgi:hypothetical protein